VASPKPGNPAPVFSATPTFRSEEQSSPASKRRKSTPGQTNSTGNPIPELKPSYAKRVRFQPNTLYQHKYSATRPNSCLSNSSDPARILKNSSFIPPTALLLKTQDLISASISNTTWKNYASALRSFQKFERHTKVSHPWPLDIGALRAFTSFSLSKEGGLSPSSISNYLAALKFIHLIKGLTPPRILDDDLIKILIKGARNINPTPSFSNRRRIVSLPLLQALKEEIDKSSWSAYLKSTIWTIFSVAFFASARMGELLSPSRTSFDASSTLRIRDVLVRESGIMIHIRAPKSGNPKGEFLYLFPFPHRGLCPVGALKTHLSLVLKEGQPPHLPLFRDDVGYTITVDYINIALRQLLKFRIDFKDHSISAHSFRAGLPSEMQRLPSLLSSDDIKGWSRWNSDCIARYERLDAHQKEKIFDKISSALISSF